MAGGFVGGLGDNTKKTRKYNLKSSPYSFWRRGRDVVFHSLRHSSTTYKLKLNHGDIKATQGDTGHAQPDMVTEVYSHILDEDRKINAQRFEAGFYANPDMRQAEKTIRETSGVQMTPDVANLVKQLQANPELASVLVQLLGGRTS